MFSKKHPDPATLSDEGLQQALDALARRQRLKERIGMGLLFLGIAAGLGLGGLYGYTMAVLFDASTEGLLCTTALFGFLGMGGATCASESIGDRSHWKAEWKRKPFTEELERRHQQQAAEEERLKMPLDSKAREAFLLALGEGAKDKVAILKPLRLKRTAAEFAA